MKETVSVAEATMDEVVLPERRMSSGGDYICQRRDPRVAELSWNNASQLLVSFEQELTQQIHDLKHQPGADIVLWGGARLAQSFARLGLIDEYQLLTQPIALGAGRSPFADLDSWRTLRLAATRAFDTDAVISTYTTAD